MTEPVKGNLGLECHEHHASIFAAHIAMRVHLDPDVRFLTR